MDDYADDKNDFLDDVGEKDCGHAEEDLISLDG